MKRLAAILLIALAATSCQRSAGQVWEDTKTAGRYIGKGFKSLAGRQNDYAFWDSAPDYIPLEDADNSYTPSRESPGDPGSPIPGIDGFHSPMGRLAALFSNVHFDTDKDVIKGTENLATLRAIADHLASHPRTYVFIEGHADERGAAAYNLALSSRRANSIRAFLIENGASPDQLFTISYGKERPLAQGHDPDTWRLNRRGAFRLYEK